LRYIIAAARKASGAQASLDIFRAGSRMQKLKTVYELYGRECGAGWNGIIRPLEDNLLRLGGEVLQIKEKFGGLVFTTVCRQKFPNMRNASSPGRFGKPRQRASAFARLAASRAPWPITGDIVSRHASNAPRQGARSGGARQRRVNRDPDYRARLFAGKRVGHGVIRQRGRLQIEFLGMRLRIGDEQADHLNRRDLGTRAGAKHGLALLIRQRRVLKDGGHKTPALIYVVAGGQIGGVALNVHPALEDFAGLKHFPRVFGPGGPKARQGQRDTEKALAERPLHDEPPRNARIARPRQKYRPAGIAASDIPVSTLKMILAPNC
jgi:hypothetical protein